MVYWQIFKIAAFLLPREGMIKFTHAWIRVVKFWRAFDMYKYQPYGQLFATITTSINHRNPSRIGYLKEAGARILLFYRNLFYPPM
jgi:hypothetical protein